jgi:hypothetical protein
MATQDTVRDERGAPSGCGRGRGDWSMRAPGSDDALCRRCGYHPASHRISGYCSWDCHDADGDEEEEPVAA